MPAIKAPGVVARIFLIREFGITAFPTKSGFVFRHASCIKRASRTASDPPRALERRFNPARAHRAPALPRFEEAERTNRKKDNRERHVDRNKTAAGEQKENGEPAARRPAALVDVLLHWKNGDALLSQRKPAPGGIRVTFIGRSLFSLEVANGTSIFSGLKFHRHARLAQW